MSEPIDDTDYRDVEPVSLPVTGDEPEVTVWNYYRCNDCRVKWDSGWNGTVNDRCPECGREIEPHESLDEDN